MNTNQIFFIKIPVYQPVNFFMGVFVGSFAHMYHERPSVPKGLVEFKYPVFLKPYGMESFVILKYGDKFCPCNQFFTMIHDGSDSIQQIFVYPPPGTKLLRYFKNCLNLSFIFFPNFKAPFPVILIESLTKPGE